MSTAKPISGLTFEDALSQLESIVDRLESGETPLEDAIGLYQRGTALKTHCEKKLRSAEERVQKITLDSDGMPTDVEDRFSGHASLQHMDDPEDSEIPF